jgi:hypothetical protein
VAEVDKKECVCRDCFSRWSSWRRVKGLPCPDGQGAGVVSAARCSQPRRYILDGFQP